MVTAARAALERIRTALPGGGEERAGQQTMVEAVERALVDGRHLVVQAGTGTGKSLGYLVPAVLSGRRVVVATATKALQDQLAEKDLPFLQRQLPRTFRWAVLKGRSNYVCRQRLAEIATEAQLELDGLGGGHRAELERVLEWAEDTRTGDLAELDPSPPGAVWAAVSVGPTECPGARRCPQGGNCFAEAARAAAADADLVVVNQHLLGLDLVTDGSILPEHDIVVVDEAHQLEDVVSAAAGFELTEGRILAFTRTARAILAGEDLLEAADAAGSGLAEALDPLVGSRVRPPVPEDLHQRLSLARERVDRVMQAVRKVPDDGPLETAARKQRAMQAAGHLLVDLDLAAGLLETDVAWVEDPGRSPVLRVAPLDVRQLLHERLFGKASVVLTSATIPANLPDRLGMEAEDTDVIDVGSPFDYEANALLYCAAHLPDPRDPGYRPALHTELERLILAAGGRTLALFTSRRAMEEAVAQLRPRLPWPVLAQGERPKAALVESFAEDEASCLFATMSFWQGVDVPGAALSLVTIDRLPFPRPDDPLLEARRELAGPSAFSTIDVPRAATLLAQGAGRLIRTAEDRGVVAVLDPRLATARRYRWDIIRALPPMRRTKDRDDAVAFLTAIRDARDA
ncbi:MAG: ATP-dependent DNA helicase [Acidimicrobiales bacterium]|jgi:ATP-dependent DNA helicase DinG|nr:ATP-dependent DNA helicase [Acidimicrobiales bacterium]